MADYKPPTEQLPIFDTTVFLSGDQAITQNQADKRYLRYPNAQGTENLQAINVNGVADFNTLVNIDGILTTTNAINMIGGSTALNNIATRQLSLKDITTGNSNGSSILTSNSVLTVDSVGPTNTNTITQFTLRNTSNAIITPLQLTPTINNMNVSLDMTNPTTGTLSYLNSIMRARLFELRDLDTSTTLTNCGMYFSSNILQIDSNKISTATPTLLYLRTTNNTGTGLVNSLMLSSSDITTGTPTIPLTTDNSNKIPTTAWVQNVLTAYIPPAPITAVKRAWVKKDNISSLVNGYSLTIPDAGTGSTTWSINEMVSFRLSFNQEWNQSGGRNQIFNSSSCILNVYPYRFTAAWLTQNIGSPTLGSLYTRGTISDNTIYATSSTNNYVVNDATYCPNGRQFFSYDLLNSQSGTTTAKLNISGDPSGLLLGRVTIWVVNPPGYNAAATPQNYNLSVELLNPSDLTAGITASGGWDVGF
jgi:hypothetical protein